jgi:FKBP-type peptidyl-prolyl cis-trans isomerase (trigger factor)
MNINTEKLPNSEIKLTVTLEASKVAESYNKIVEKLVSEADIKGFRKGKAPKEVVLEKADVSKVHGEVISDLLKTYYPIVLKEKGIFPYSNPKIDIKEFELEKDFIFEATIALKPEVKIGDYKKIVKKLLDEKKKEIKKAEKEASKEEPKEGEEAKTETPKTAELTAEEIVDAISNDSKIELSELLINEETDRLLERFISQIRGLNLNVEQLLQAQGKTYDDLLADHKKIAENNIKSEFILNEIIKAEKIEATDTEIEEFIKNLGDENLQKQFEAPSEKWYIKGIIEKNKALDYLKNLGKEEK